MVEDTSSQLSIPEDVPEVDNGKDLQIGAFSEGDPEDPRNWPQWRKFAIVGVMIPVDLSVSFAASGYSPASSDFAKDMGVSSTVATLGLSLYVIGLSLGPMSLAPLSEYYGRRPIYVISYGIFLLFLMATALVPNLGGFLVLRLISGLFASVTIANYGGSIADLYHPHDTGPAMSLFLWAATCGSPMGYFLMSFVAQHHPWRTVFWALLGISGGLWLLMTITMFICGETRHNIILLHRVRAAQRSNPESNITLPPALQQRGPRELFGVALTRPFRFIATEAIIVFGAVFNGYLYGLSFLFNGAFALVFGNPDRGHGFSTQQIGLCFLGIVTGITIGPVINLLQERHFQRRVREAGNRDVPEARLQTGMVAACIQPLSLFWFAWTSMPEVHFMVPIIASAFWGWSFYTLILMTYVYTEDAYKEYAASALAGISLIRNLGGGAFPLFGEQMYTALGYQWASSLLAFLACVLVSIPFVLSRYGEKLRDRSPWAKGKMDEDGESALLIQEDG